MSDIVRSSRDEVEYSVGAPGRLTVRGPHGSKGSRERENDACPRVGEFDRPAEAPGETAVQ